MIDTQINVLTFPLLFLYPFRILFDYDVPVLAKELCMGFNFSCTNMTAALCFDTFTHTVCVETMVFSLKLVCRLLFFSVVFSIETIDRKFR